MLTLKKAQMMTLWRDMTPTKHKRKHQVTLTQQCVRKMCNVCATSVFLLKYEFEFLTDTQNMFSFCVEVTDINARHQGQTPRPDMTFQST